MYQIYFLLYLNHMRLISPIIPVFVAYFVICKICFRRVAVLTRRHDVALQLSSRSAALNLTIFMLML